MRSTYEVLIEDFPQDMIHEMVLEYEAHQIHGQYISNFGPLDQLRVALEKEGFQFQTRSKALSAISQYVLIEYAKLIKKYREKPTLQDTPK